MKNTSLVKTAIGLTIAAIGILAAIMSRTAHADPPAHAAVTFNSWMNGDQAGYHGILIFVSSSSVGAPSFPQYVTANGNSGLVTKADAIASLLNQGFHFDHADASTGEEVWVR